MTYIFCFYVTRVGLLIKIQFGTQTTTVTPPHLRFTNPKIGTLIGHYAKGKGKGIQEIRLLLSFQSKFMQKRKHIGACIHMFVHKLLNVKYVNVMYLYICIFTETVYLYIYEVAC